MKSLSFLPDQVREMAEQGGWVFWALIALAFGIAFALADRAEECLPHQRTFAGSTDARDHAQAAQWKFNINLF